MSQKNWNDLEKASMVITRKNADGVVETITWGELQKARLAKKRAENKGKKKKLTYVQLLPSHVERLVKGIKVLNSLRAYYDNGYRQWGTIAHTIMDNPMIKSHYISFRMLAYDIAELQKKINEIGKGNEKAIFAYLMKMSYKVEDIQKVMVKLVHGVEESRVCEFYANKEAINGEGRRLGLRILMLRTLDSINDMGKVFKELSALSEEGVDVMEYAPNGKRISY